MKLRLRSGIGFDLCWSKFEIDGPNGHHLAKWTSRKAAAGAGIDILFPQLRFVKDRNGLFAIEIDTRTIDKHIKTLKIDGCETKIRKGKQRARH